ncbi:MAG: carbohydrate ABC transporter permease [Clostridiales bacterium]|nr:carbohydrate ABC transporter permease [Clostridiales bacterium]
MIIPFVWMISTALKSRGELFVYPPVWIPEKLQWVNFLTVFETLPFGQFFLNSMKVALLQTAGTLISCSSAAYAFARLRFWGKEALFAIVLLTMMIPGQVTMIPVFIIMRFLGWYDTHLPLWVPSFFGSAFGIFLLRQFFSTLPTELDDAAKIDGCNYLQIFCNIYLPLSKPALATLAVMTFMGSWNNLLGPVIYLKTIDKLTLTVGLTFFQGQYVTDYTLLMAGSLISIMPILILYVIAQKYFVRGIALTGIKG